MATHASTLAWRIPGTGEPGGLQSMAKTSVVFPMPTGETGHVLALLTKVSIKKRLYLGLLLKRKCAFFFPLIFGKDL